MPTIGSTMVCVPSVPRPRGGAPAPVLRYTVEELARAVAMSPRNIRAHQARRLLDPPVRLGRSAYYTALHVRRLEAIKALQRQGFNLVAIQAILGTSTGSPAEPAQPTAHLVGELLDEIQQTAETLAQIVRRSGPRGQLTPDMVDLLTEALRGALTGSSVRTAGRQADRPVGPARSDGAVPGH